jgi:hypothetical protein
MNFSRTLVLVLLLLFVNFIKSSCIVHNDLILIWTNKNQKVEFQFHGKGKYLFFGYNEKNSTLKSFSFQESEGKFIFTQENNFFKNVKTDTAKYSTLFLSTLSFEMDDISSVEQFHISSSNYFENVTDSLVSNFYSFTPESALFHCEIQTPRFIEGLHSGVSLPSIGFYLVLFCFCLLLQSEQPMKSRSISPLIYLFFTFGVLFSQVFFYTTTIQWRMNYYCYIHGFFVLTLYSGIIFLIFLNDLRFILKTIFYQKIRETSTKKSKSFYLPLLTVYKFMFTPLSVIVASGLFVFIFGFISMVLGLIMTQNGVCSSFRVDNIIHFVVRIVLFILIVGLQILDVVLNFTKFLNLYKFFVDYDPFTYRFQIVLTTPFFLYFLTTNIVQFFAPNDIQLMIFETISIYISLIIHILVPLFITILKYFMFQCVNKNKFNVEKLPTYLSKSGVKHHFELYCEAEWCLEYLYLWEMLKNFPKIKQENMKKAAIGIENTFLNINSIFKVEVNQGNRREIRNAIASNSLNHESMLNLLKATENKLVDSFFRFSLTKEFKELGLEETLRKQSMHLLNDYTEEIIE